MSQPVLELWKNLMTTSVHLDSGLSRLKPDLKSRAAPFFQSLLRVPHALIKKSGLKIKLKRDRFQLGTQDVGRLWEYFYTREAVLRKPPVGDEQDFPIWMMAELKKDWGAQHSKKLAERLSESPQVCLRISGGRRKEVAQALASELNTKMSEFVFSHRVETALILPGYFKVLKTKIYEREKFEIQDEGSQIMARFALWPEQVISMLSPAPCSFKNQSVLKHNKPLEGESKGERVPSIVIDACAGAGGKTLAMAELLKGRGRVFAYDIVESKIQALKKRAVTLGLNNIQGHVLPKHQPGGGAELEKWLAQFKESADVVLVDAPCSGWGVLRRNPDIKWRQTQDELKRLPVLQLELLERFSALVRPGGRLVYGLCTFRRAESEQVVEDFALKHPEFQSIGGGYLGPDTSDGFFMWAWERG